MSQTWKEIKDEWNGGNKQLAILHFFRRLPQMTYPGGDIEYYRVIDSVGFRFTGKDSGPTWWREIFHFLGGVLLTLPFIAYPSACFIASFVVVALSFVNEFFGDAKTKIDLKNFVDWGVWTSGTFFVSFLSSLLFGPETYL